MEFQRGEPAREIIIGPYFLTLYLCSRDQIRKTCIEALSEHIKSGSVFDNIVLAKKYKVEKWLRDGYIQLLQQKQALELGEDICTSELDVITIARLLYIRERRHCRQVMISSAFSTDEANKKIDEVFADEIAEMQDD